ncbi:hypothetical protein Csa_004166 [Cucumis sativus]|nr:hypothetical protein Csa_004166 [Cucumis sativus]
MPGSLYAICRALTVIPDGLRAWRMRSQAYPCLYFLLYIYLTLISKAAGKREEEKPKLQTVHLHFSIYFTMYFTQEKEYHRLTDNKYQKECPIDRRSDEFNSDRAVMRVREEGSIIDLTSGDPK